MRPEAYQIMEDCERSYWWYRIRREIIVDTIRRFVPSGSNLLDYGCGTGSIAERLRECGYRVTVTDVSESALDVCRRRGLAIIAPEQLAQLDAGFDGILACDVLEHVEDDVAEFCRLANVLQPGGLLLATVPAYEFLWSGEDYISEHVRRYSARSLAASLHVAGFKPLWMSHFNTFLFPQIAAVILGKRVFRPREMYRSNIRPLPSWLDAALGRIFALERFWLMHLRFPFGTSLITVAYREDPSQARSLGSPVTTQTEPPTG